MKFGETVWNFTIFLVYTFKLFPIAKTVSPLNVDAYVISRLKISAHISWILKQCVAWIYLSITKQRLFFIISSCPRIEASLYDVKSMICVCLLCRIWSSFILLLMKDLCFLFTITHKHGCLHAMSFLYHFRLCWVILINDTIDNDWVARKLWFCVIPCCGCILYFGEIVYVAKKFINYLKKDVSELPEGLDIEKLKAVNLVSLKMSNSFVWCIQQIQTSHTKKLNFF